MICKDNYVKCRKYNFCITIYSTNDKNVNISYLKYELHICQFIMLWQKQ